MKINNLHTELLSFTYYSLNGKMRSMDTQIAIYALIDPRTKLPFYVGKINRPKIRLKSHRTGRGITPTAWRAIMAAKTKEERRAMMAAANAANKRSPWIKETIP